MKWLVAIAVFFGTSLSAFAAAASAKTWYSVESPTKANLSDLDFAEDGTGYAVGNEGTFLKYDGYAWSRIPFASEKATMVFVGAISRDEAWVFLRTNNIVQHYVDNHWESVVFEREFAAQGVDFSSRKLGYAVGLFGLMYRFDGTRWDQVHPPNLTHDRESHLTGVAVVAENDVWVSGQQFLLHFDGTTWTRSEVPAHIGGIPQVYRVDDAVILAGDVPMVRRGANWESLSINALLMPAGGMSELWGLVRHGESGRLQQVLPRETADRASGPPANAIARGKDGLWAVGNHGSILHLEPNLLPAFLDRTFDAGAGVQAESTLAFFVDLDGAGLRDLALVAPFGRNSFLCSDEGGTFRSMPLVYPGLAALPTGNHLVWADMDGDGWVDIVNRPESRPGTESVDIWRNLGGFRFWSAPSGITSTTPEVYDIGGIEVFDFDGDNDLDIYEIRSLTKFGGFPAPNLLHRNDGFGRFTTEPIFQRNGGAAWSWTHAVASADFTGDGRPDIITANSWGMGNTFYKKNELGEYVDATAESGLAGDAHLVLGLVSGDIDNDGALDVLVLTSVDFGPSRLYRNDGFGHFHDITTESGLDRIFAAARQAQFVDMDLDGDLDLVLGNALERFQETGAVGRLRLLINDGSGHFSDATVKANIDQSTTAFVADDFDDDGDIDLYLVRSGEANRLLQNESPRHGYLKVRLESSAPNRVALGARVSIFRPDGSIVGVRETNWQQPIAHFGVADLSHVDVEVRFPSGDFRREKGIATGREVVISEHVFPIKLVHDVWFFFRHRWAWADGRRDIISLLASFAFLAGLWRLSHWLGTRFYVRRRGTMTLLWAAFFLTRLLIMPLEPISTAARILPLSILSLGGLGLLFWDRRVTNRADARFVGPYELLAEIGRGGMGTVHRARDTSLVGKPIVALKILNPDRVRDASSMRRFVREAEIGAKLRNPGIVSMLASGECRVFERGQWQSTAYLAMEFVEGTSLASVIFSADRLPLVRQLEILRDAALALHAAHSQSILHRDVKPDNILLSRGGVVKLVDFGIAAIAAAPSQTDVGFLVGTIAYMPPERIAGKIEDARGDLYSLGVTMYELIAGKRPFDADNLSTVELLRAIVERRPTPLLEICSDILPRIDALNQRLLAKRPSDRPANAQEVADEFENILRELRGESTTTLGPLSAVVPAPAQVSDLIVDSSETQELPVPPKVIVAARRLDDALARETLDLPLDLNSGPER